METLHQMSQTRCSVPDIFENNDNETNVTTSNLHIGKFKESVRMAFEIWYGRSRFNFIEVNENKGGNIRISFERGVHGDYHPLTNDTKTLAHTFAPTDGRFHFNADKPFSVEATYGAYHLKTVALHELGHAFGLAHSPSEDSIVFPTIPTNVEKDLDTDDIKEVDDVENKYLNVLEIVVSHRVDEHIKNDTLCRTDIDSTIVERSIVRHVIDDFIDDVDEHLSHASGTNTMLSFPSGFNEVDVMFLEFVEELDNPTGGSSSVGDNSVDTSQPSATSTPKRRAQSRLLELERYVIVNGRISMMIAPGTEKPTSPHVVRFSQAIGLCMRKTFLVRYLKWEDVDREYIEVIKCDFQNQMLELQSQPTPEDTQPLSRDEICKTEEIAATFAEALVVEIVVAIVDVDAIVLAAMTKMTVLLSALCSFSLEHGEFLLRHDPKNDAVEEQVEIWTDFDFLSEFGSSKTVVDDAEFPVFFGVPAVKIEFRKLEKLPPDGLK
ncbi:metalloendoproteinase 1-like [Cucumis melo var. makuwa]|uniref:Metalloendoproteinase 1-like n=1 Tax=Cucumis melo var. makuwa TaxID=1194695 RepID=A0A5A7T3A0_CUCMM|nr:metalloendoproteinase 1-like [Cucumis melo var. makuwa]